MTWISNLVVRICASCRHLSDPPVQAHPITFEQWGELRPGVIQSGHELVLTEGSNLRRSLNTQTVSYCWHHCEVITYNPLPVYLPRCYRSLQRHQARHVPLLTNKTQGLQHTQQGQFLLCGWTNRLSHHPVISSYFRNIFCFRGVTSR